MAEREDLRARVSAQRAEREARDRLRVRRTVLRRDGVRCELEDADGSPRWLVNFCGNDYLGLAQQFAVANALADGAMRTGAGSGLTFGKASAGNGQDMPADETE